MEEKEGKEKEITLNLKEDWFFLIYLFFTKFFRETKKIRKISRFRPHCNKLLKEQLIPMHEYFKKVNITECGILERKEKEWEYKDVPKKRI